MNKFLFVVLVLGTGFGLRAQNSIPDRCASYDYLQRQIANDPNRQQEIDREEANYQQFLQAHPNGYQARAVVVVPVVFHVVYKTAGQNLADTRLTEQISVLNEDYRKLNWDNSLVPSVWASLAADCEIEFCIAQRDPSGNWTSGIERRQTTVTSWTSNDSMKFYSSGGLDAWDRSKYLNIWVCNLGSNLLGYSTFPGGPANTDGVVLNFNYVGITGALSPYNRGRTATHEIGHWFNLRHTWGDDGGSCFGSDNVSDTPNQAIETYGNPSFPLTDNCTTTSPGIMFMDYMDYTDDAGMFMFTQGQKTRMWSALNGARLSIQSSDGCLVNSVSEAIYAHSISVYPSPTTGEFTIHFGTAIPDNCDVTVYDVLGQSVSSQHYEGLRASDIHVDLTGNNDGIYFVEIRAGNEKVTRKIVLDN